MRSNTFPLAQNAGQLAGILNEVDRCAAANGLGKKKALQLRLLAEELNGMLPALLEISEGVFWLENEDSHYRLHVSLRAVLTSARQHDRLLSVSSSGKNAAAVGIMGRIRCAAEKALLSLSAPANSCRTEAWTLKDYRTQVENERVSDQRIELERSIIANLADDAVVAISGSRVEVTIHKYFWD